MEKDGTKAILAVATNSELDYGPFLSLAFDSEMHKELIS